MKRHTRARVLAALVLGASALAAPSTFAGTTDGTVIGATKLLDNGSDAERFDIVIVGDGYRSTEQARFAVEAQAFHDRLVGTPPFDRLTRALNVWRLDVESIQSGADDPLACGGSGLRPRTYFDASFCTGSVEQGLLTVNHLLVLGTVDNFVPAWDQVVVLVNSAIPGGLAGSVAITSVAPEWQAGLLHTIGHSAFGLADEYDHFDGCGVDVGRETHPAIEPVAPNVTVETSLALLEWADLVDPATPVPTTSNPDESCTSCDARPDPYPEGTIVGLYEGGHHFPCGAFRPAFRCAMRDLGPFCPVCARRIAETLAPFLTDGTNQPPECDAGGPYHAECDGPSTVVALDASGSSDPDGDPLLYEWSGAFEGQTTAGSPAQVGFGGVGGFAVTLVVDDGVEAATCMAEVVVEDTIAPTLAAPADVQVECSGSAGTSVDLGAPTVEDACDPAVRVTNDAPAAFPDGESTVTWRAVDASGNAATAAQRVTVADDEPPAVEIQVSPSVLWPPNHRLVPVVVTIAVTDECDRQPVVRLVSVSSSEAEREAGSGATEADIVGAAIGTDDREIRLRAERAGGAGGRVYTIVYEAIDAAGNRSEHVAQVLVPPDRGAHSEGGTPRARGRSRR